MEIVVRCLTVQRAAAAPAEGDAAPEGEEPPAPAEILWQEEETVATGCVELRALLEPLRRPDAAPPSLDERIQLTLAPAYAKRAGEMAKESAAKIAAIRAKEQEEDGYLDEEGLAAAERLAASSAVLPELALGIAWNAAE